VNKLGAKPTQDSDAGYILLFLCGCDTQVLPLPEEPIQQQQPTAPANSGSRRQGCHITLNPTHSAAITATSALRASLLRPRCAWLASNALQQPTCLQHKVRASACEPPEKGEQPVLAFLAGCKMLTHHNL
jgi:hypothetical protein